MPGLAGSPRQPRGGGGGANRRTPPPSHVVPLPWWHQNAPTAPGCVRACVSHPRPRVVTSALAQEGGHCDPHVPPPSPLLEDARGRPRGHRCHPYVTSRVSLSPPCPTQGGHCHSHVPLPPHCRPLGSTGVPATCIKSTGVQHGERGLLAGGAAESQNHHINPPKSSQALKMLPPQTPLAFLSSPFQAGAGKGPPWAPLARVRCQHPRREGDRTLPPTMGKPRLEAKCHFGPFIGRGGGSPRGTPASRTPPFSCPRLSPPGCGKPPASPR